MRSFLLIIFFFLLVQPIQAQKKLFIIGGGKRPPALMERMFVESELNKGGYAVILPMASEEPDSAIFYAKLDFKKNGVENVAGMKFISDEKISASRSDSLLNARLIYIAGGDQNRFMKVALETQLYEILQKVYEKGIMIAGTSAGAAVMSEKMITGNERNYPDYSQTFRTIEAENIELARGLGFLKNVIVDQHFVQRSRHNRLISAVIEHPDVEGIGIDEATALLVKGTEAEVVGDAQVLVYSNPGKSKLVKNDKLGAKDMKLSIYLPEEKFSLHNKAKKTSK